MQIFTNPHISHIILALSNDFLLHQKNLPRSNGYNFDPSYTATAQSGRGGNFALGYTGGNLIGASNVSPAVVRDVWTTQISADFLFKKKRPKIDRRDIFFWKLITGFLIAKSGVVTDFCKGKYWKTKEVYWNEEGNIIEETSMIGFLVKFLPSHFHHADWRTPKVLCT